MNHLLAACLFIASVAGAADREPFAGTWRYKADKSQQMQVYKIYTVGDGKFQTENGLGRGPILPVDGSPHESPQGGIVTLKKIDDRTYVYTLKRKSQYKRTITLDGDKMTWAEDQEMDTGKHELSESYWQRVGNGTGLAGEWHRTGYKDPSEATETETIRVIPGGLRFGSSDRKREEDLYFDGKERPSQDPDGINKMSEVGERLNAHSFRWISKRNGEVVFTSTCVLSEDENTMTCTNIDRDGRKNVYVQERVSR
jgi:hypothetical protein